MDKYHTDPMSALKPGKLDLPNRLPQAPGALGRVVSGPEGMARNLTGSKNTQTEFAPVINHVRPEDKAGSHPLAHADARRPLVDPGVEKSFVGKGAEPTAYGMKASPVPDDVLRGQHDRQSGNRVLKEASLLGSESDAKIPR
jgi:hypothetical protein